jgi:uncharacterized membrane protein
MAAAIGLGAGIIAVTIAVTIARYRDLPEAIPIHFGLDGKPNWYGPRITIWLIPGIQLLITATALSLGAQTPHSSLVFWLAILVLCCSMQLLIIAAATNGTQRLNIRAFWVVFVATMGVAVAVAFRWIG